MPQGLLLAISLAATVFMAIFQTLHAVGRCLSIDHDVARYLRKLVHGQ